MKVEKEIFYHIHIGQHYVDLWNPGNQFDIPKHQINPYYKYFNDITVRLSKTPEGQLALYEFFVTQKNNNWNTIENESNPIKKQVITDLALQLREQVFEKVREQFFSELPSRMCCIWVCRERSVPCWAHTLDGMKIFEIELSGEVHHADARPLKIGELILRKHFMEIFDHHKIYAKALRYWSGTDGSNPDGEETLFVGTVRVVEDVTKKFLPFTGALVK